MHLSRSPIHPALCPFIERVWASDQGHPTASRELVLPTAQGHLVVRVSERPLRVYAGPGDRRGRESAHAVLGGPRSSPFIRDVSEPVRCMGAQLRPGAVQALFGVPADELSGRHTDLEDLWPGSRFRERLCEEGALALQLNRFEALLAERLSDARGIHPAVAHALSRFGLVGDVDRVRRETGYSHRHFAVLFRQAVGMLPKRYCRVRRFKATLERLAASPEVEWVALAQSSGFSDQAHLVREFRALSGLTPGQYRRLAPSWSRHVPIA